jgi:hypothetical protein
MVLTPTRTSRRIHPTLLQSRGLIYFINLLDRKNGPLIEQYLSLANLIDDLFRCISLFGHTSPLYEIYNLYCFRKSRQCWLYILAVDCGTISGQLSPHSVEYDYKYYEDKK